MTLTLLETWVQRQGDEMAIAHSEWRITGAATPPGNGEGHFTFACERVDGVWRLVALQNTSRALAAVARGD